MPRYVIEGVWTVFFDPGRQLRCWNGRRSRSAYHGKLSSASTGRLAMLLLPLELVLSELNSTESCAAGASTSISSSKSDMLLEAMRFFWCRCLEY